MSESDSMSHLRQMKRRLTMVQPEVTGLTEDMSTVEKVDMLENTLNVFRAEVDMKMKIMQQILKTRNEQVTVHKKLLEREQSLYETLLGHWTNTPNLAARGLSVNFSAADIVSDIEEDVENQSDPDYVLGDDGLTPKRRKYTKSTLRRQRKSAKSKNVAPRDGSSFSGRRTHNEQEAEGEFIDPSLHMQMKTDVEGDDEDQEDGNDNGFPECPEDDSEAATATYDKYVSTLKGKITYKLSSRGYTYSKRGQANGTEYYMCDQRRICGASLVYKDGRWRQGTKHWTRNGTHAAHPPDFERTLAQIEKSKRFLTKKHKKHRRHPERYRVPPEVLEQALEEMGSHSHNLDTSGQSTSAASSHVHLPDLDTSFSVQMQNKSEQPLPLHEEVLSLTCDLHPSSCPGYNTNPPRDYC